jgi:hypothetical protein
MTGKIDEDKYKQKLFINYNALRRKTEERQVVDSYVTIGEELFRNMVSENNVNLVDIISHLYKLREIGKNALKSIDANYQHKGIVSHTLF